MKSLRDRISETASLHKALGHFNFGTAEMLRGIVLASVEVAVPVIVGVSEGEQDFIGVKQARDLAFSLRDQLGAEIFLNADHTKSFERAKEVIDAGYDAIVMDASALSFNRNVAVVKQAIQYAKEKGRDIIIEGELGFIGTSSEVLDFLPPGVPVEEAKMTKPEEAKKFIEETGADQLAPAVGNVHGIVGPEGNPKLSIKRIAEIRSACGVPLVLHGASGISESDVREAVRAGCATVHFSTDLRLAFRKSLAASLAESPDEVSPYKYMREPIKAVKEVVKSRLSWLG